MATLSPLVKDRLLGSLFGMAVGDALGTTLEFGPRRTDPAKYQRDITGGGPFRLPVGCFTDDTSMGLCMAESLAEKGRFDLNDIAFKFSQWMQNGHMSPTGRCFDIGNTTSNGIMGYLRTGNPLSGSTSENAGGNGCIMRLAPVPMFFWKFPHAALQASAMSSRTTHGATLCTASCKYMAAILVTAYNDPEPNAVNLKQKIIQPNYPFLNDHFASREKLHPLIEKIRIGGFATKSRTEINSGGAAHQALEAALWAIYTTSSFEEAIIEAVNLGNDADTVGAICGQIAGALYGYSAIPARWLEKLRMKDLLDAIGQELCRLSDALVQNQDEAGEPIVPSEIMSDATHQQYVRFMADFYVMEETYRERGGENTAKFSSLPESGLKRDYSLILQGK